MRNVRPLLPAQDDGQINLTPMLDVVFIMLIFFVVTATFVRETGLEAGVSDSDLEIRRAAEAILVVIDSGDAVWIDGRKIDQRAVRANIERMHAKNPDSAVIIEPASASTTKTLVAIIDAARAANVEFSIAPSDSTELTF